MRFGVTAAAWIILVGPGCLSPVPNVFTHADASTPPCSLPCPLGDECVVVNDAPACRSVCNPPCPNVTDQGWYCDVPTRTCKRHESPRCGPCERGQNCFDLAGVLTGDPQEDASAPCTCLPAFVSTATGEVLREDSCEAFGLVCRMDLQHPSPTACSMPREFELCQRSVGCDDALDCKPSFFYEEDGEYRCVRPCTKTSDCPHPDMKCWSNDSRYPPGLRLHCYFNQLCAEDSKTGRTDPTKYFSACTATTTSDGQCLPYNVALNQDSFGMCRQTGTAPSLGECDPNAVRPNLSQMCPRGEYCEPIMPGAGESVRGICRKLCNGAPDGSQRVPALNCGGSQACTDESQVPVTATIGKDARIGFCRDGCDLLSGAPQCISSDILGNAQGCQYNARVEGTSGACRPVSPTASGVGGNCSGPVASDTRASCTDKLACLSDSTCHEFCDRNQCSDPGRPCAQCSGGTACQDAGVGRLGICVAP